MPGLRTSACIYAQVRHLPDLLPLDGVRRPSSGRDKVELVKTILDAVAPLSGVYARNKNILIHGANHVD